MKNLYLITTLKSSMGLKLIVEEINVIIKPNRAINVNNNLITLLYSNIPHIQKQNIPKK